MTLIIVSLCTCIAYFTAICLAVSVFILSFKRSKKYCIPFLKRFMIILMQIDDLFLVSKFILDVGTICHYPSLCF